MENKNAKYFKYAIGEILLVVIGILIAVSINNWNDYRVNRALENGYLRGIIADVDVNITRMGEIIETSTAIIASGNYLLAHFKNPTQKQSSILLSHMSNLMPANHFQPRDIVFEDLKSSGRLQLISNDSLKLKIQEYYHHNKRVSSVVNSNGEYKFETFNSYLPSIDVDMNSIFYDLSFNFANADGIVEIDAFNDDFLYRSRAEPDVKEFINRLSTTIVLEQLNVFRANSGIEMGELLKVDINQYLNN